MAVTRKDAELISRNPAQQWFYNIGEVAIILGKCREKASALLAQRRVPYYEDGRSKMYFLPDVLEAVNKTRGRA